MSSKSTHLAEWKVKALEEAISFLSPKGKVLLVGFGSGKAAEKILALKPTSLTIIEKESADGVLASIFAKNHKNVTVVRLPWQEGLKDLPTYDSVIFAEGSLQEDIHIVNYLYKDEVRTLSFQAKELLLKLEEEFSKIKRTYTDHEIDEFYQTQGRFNQKELAHFLLKLKKNGQITEDQYSKSLQKYQLNTILAKEHLDADPFFEFLEMVSKTHLEKGGKVVSFLSPEVNKHDHKLFFEKIIANPFLNYSEKIVTVPLSDKNMPVKAQLLLIEKLA